MAATPKPKLLAQQVTLYQRLLGALEEPLAPRVQRALARIAKRRPRRALAKSA